MKKIIARLIVSGIVGALVIVFCIEVLFAPPTYVDCFNLINTAYSSQGQITKFTSNTEDSQIQIAFVNELIFLNGEIENLESNYTKLNIVSNVDSSADLLNQKIKEMCNKLNTVNENIENYVEFTDVEGFPEETKATMALQLSNDMKDVLTLLQQVNENLNEFLFAELYRNNATAVYTCNSVSNILTKLYLSLSVEDASYADDVANVVERYNIFCCDTSTLNTISQTEEFVDFCELVEQFDLTDIICSDDTYRDTLSSADQISFDFMTSYIFEAVII